MKKLIYIALAILLIFNSSCEKYDEVKVPESYQKVLVLQSSGELPLTLYRTGEDSKYPMCIMKVGSGDGLAAKFQLEVDQEWLEQYNADNYKQLVMLPSEYYSFDAQNWEIAGNEKYKIIDLVLKTVQIEALMKEHPDTEYALSIQLKSDDATISKTNNYVILKPSIVIPTVSFEQTGYNKNIITPNDALDFLIEIPIKLPLVNMWTFDCTVEVDETLLAEYNIAHNTSYKLLPSSSYELDKTCHFIPGTDYANIKLLINRTKLPNFGDYVLPLYVANCSQTGFNIAENAVHLAGISYWLPQIALSLDMLSANATKPTDGKGLAGLFDGIGAGKHYHTDRKIKDPIGHYIDIHMNSPVSKIMFDYFTRFENGNAAPLEIVLYTKADADAEWVKLATVNQGLPTGGNQEYQSAMFTAEQPFSYFRFCVTKSKAYADPVGVNSNFVIGELSLFGL